MSASHFTFRRPICTCLLALVAACSDTATGPLASDAAAARSASEPEASVADISGVWNYHETATFVIWNFDAQGKKTFDCISDGTYTFVQTGATFTGKFVQTGTCVAQDGTTIDNSFPDGDVAGGTIQGRKVRFHPDNPCNFLGTLSRALTRMEGSGVCGVPEFAVYTARWTATR